MVKCFQSCGIPEMQEPMLKPGPEGRVGCEEGGAHVWGRFNRETGGSGSTYYKATIYQGRIPGSGKLAPQCSGEGLGYAHHVPLFWL